MQRSSSSNIEITDTMNPTKTNETRSFSGTHRKRMIFNMAITGIAITAGLYTVYTCGVGLAPLAGVRC